MTEEGEPVELTLRKGTIYYEKKQLEDRLNKINKIVDKIAKDHPTAKNEWYHCENRCAYCQDYTRQIQELSDV